MCTVRVPVVLCLGLWFCGSVALCRRAGVLRWSTGRTSEYCLLTEHLKPPGASATAATDTHTRAVTVDIASTSGPPPTRPDPYTRPDINMRLSLRLPGERGGGGAVTRPRRDWERGRGSPRAPVDGRLAASHVSFRHRHRARVIVEVGPGPAW